MNLLEYENSIFGDLWNEETIKELKDFEPPKKSYPADIIPVDEQAEEKYREFQESNFFEYFDPAGTYKYCLWR